jgi:hypothetical protein
MSYAPEGATGENNFEKNFILKNLDLNKMGQ